MQLTSSRVPKRRPQFIVTTALLFSVSIGIGLASCTSENSSTPAAPSTQTSSAVPVSPAPEPGNQLGQPVTVGSFTYTIESATNIGKKLSSDEGESLAQGDFVVVKMTVKNNGSSPANVVAADFTAVTANGETTAAQENDSVIANGTNPAFREGIPAGKTESVALVFDFSPATKSPVTQILVKDNGTSVTIKIA